MAEPRTPGQIGYEAYWHVRQMPTLRGWADLPSYQQFAWEAAAQAVLDAFLSSATRLEPPQEEPHGA